MGTFAPSLARRQYESAKGIDRPDDPKEFACLLAVEGDTVTELVLLPGTVSGDEHAIFEMWMEPIDSSVCGSLRSRPDQDPCPREADFELFDKHGEIHFMPPLRPRRLARVCA